LFENAIFNQLRNYGTLNYLAKGNEYEVDFIVTTETGSSALEAKYHPILSDDQKLKRIAAKYGFKEAWLVGKYPAPGFQQFVWSGLIF
jgi:predicted AAA+ superfamily ATPase